MNPKDFAFMVTVGTALAWVGRLLWYANATYPHDGGGAYLLGSALTALLAFAISAVSRKDEK